MQSQSEQQWNALWKRLGAKGDASVFYNNLVARYAESHRAYHTFLHIKNCLAEFQQVRQLATNPEAVELALWYHDAIYDTKAKDNEMRSASLAVEMVSIAFLSKSFGQLVARHILATKHTSTFTNPDTQLMMDIDLSILGQSEDKFDEYEEQVRKEYWWVPQEDFVSGRSSILKSFLNRPFIYSTQFFCNKYEMQARRNIARSITRLSV